MKMEYFERVYIPLFFFVRWEIYMYVLHVK